VSAAAFGKSIRVFFTCPHVRSSHDDAPASRKATDLSNSSTRRHRRSPAPAPGYRYFVRCPRARVPTATTSTTARSTRHLLVARSTRGNAETCWLPPLSIVVRRPTKPPPPATDPQRPPPLPPPHLRETPKNEEKKRTRPRRHATGRDPIPARNHRQRHSHGQLAAAPDCQHRKSRTLLHAVGGTLAANSLSATTTIFSCP